MPWTVKLGDGLVVPGDMEPKKLKETIAKHLDEVPVAPLPTQGINYKSKKVFIKVTGSKTADIVKIT